MSKGRVSQRDALAIWQRIYTRLGALADAGAAAQQAFDAGNPRTVRSMVHRMRGIRAALARDQAGMPRLPETAAGLTLLSKLGPVRKSAMAASQLADVWLRRDLPSESLLRESADGYLSLAERLLPAVWDVDRDLVLLVGPNAEPMARALAEYGQQRIVLFVPEPFAAPSGDLPAQTIVIRDTTELAEVGPYLGTHLPERTVAWRSSPKVSSETFQRFQAEVRQALAAATVDQNTVEAFGDLWLRQSIANLPAIANAPPFEANGEFEGVPMVIVAPGPSLAKNVHLLRELKGKALIASFSHTLAALEAAGVVPDLVLAADMEDLRYHFEGIDTREFEALALAYTVHPDLYSLPAKRTFCFSSNRTDSWLSELVGEGGEVSNGGSVAHMAFSMGVKLGCDPIILVGQDLSFPDGKVYCDDNVDGDARAELSADGATVVVKGYSAGYASMQSVGGATQSHPHRVVEVPGYFGGSVPTSTVFSMFRKWFIQQASKLGSSRVLLNCTEGGARIDGMQHLPLARAIERYVDAPVDIGARFDALADFDPEARRAAVLEGLQAHREATRRCQSVAKRGVSLIKKLEKGRTQLERLSEAETALSEAIAPVRFISLLATKELSEVSTAGKDANTLADNLASTRRLFRAVQKAADTIAPRLKRAIQQLESARKVERSA